MELTNSAILRVAMEQSAIDAGCDAADFLRGENVIVPSVTNAGARRYLTLPFSCQLISYGNNIVASIHEKFRPPVEDYLGRFSIEHCFETPNLQIMDSALQKEGEKICFMAEYFLPDLPALKRLSCPYECRELGPKDFSMLYIPPWSNALCEKRRELDVLGVGAYDGGKLIGLAACSADCDSMWQIGVDVLPDYRRQGVASALTSRLALAILERGKVPFYCAAWANIKSVRNAIRSGFRPAWVEMTAKSVSFTEAMNGSRQLSQNKSNPQ